jgi:hypothetical protein
MENEKLQTMEEALGSVPDKLKTWISGVWNAIANGKKVNPKYQQSLGRVSQKAKDAVKNFYGKNVSKQIITPKNLQHIYERHGKYIERELADRQIPVTAELAALIPDVLSNPDSVEESGLTGKNGYEAIAISKEYADGTVHVVEAVLKNNILEVWTVYVWNKEKTLKKRLAYGSSETGSHNAIPPQ